MRNARLCAAALAAALTLTACGRAPMAASAARPSTARAASASEARAHAEKFAAAVKAAGFAGTVAVDKAVVTLTGEDQPTVRYDFAQAPATGMVKVSTEGYETLVPEDKLLESAERLPQIVVAIAIQMALGGAKALAMYYIKHPNDFNKEDAIRATLTGMLSSLSQFVPGPGGAAINALVPIVVDMIMKIKVKDLKHIADVAMEQVDKLVAWIKAYVKPNQALLDLRQDQVRIAI